MLLLQFAIRVVEEEKKRSRRIADYRLIAENCAKCYAFRAFEFSYAYEGKPEHWKCSNCGYEEVR